MTGVAVAALPMTVAWIAVAVYLWCREERLRAVMGRSPNFGGDGGPG